MQQSGLVPSQPVGHFDVQTSFGQPPKHLAMPFESALHTVFLPWQQFWEAGSPKAPQMLPGGLHELPFLQNSFTGSQTMPYPVGDVFKASG
jgi:hypothetical protein